MPDMRSSFGRTLGLITEYVWNVYVSLNRLSISSLLFLSIDSSLKWTSGKINIVRSYSQSAGERG